MRCDLCEEEDCKKPMQYAHKPYVFHFYHATQYEEAVGNFQPSTEEQLNVETVGGYSGGEEDVDDTDSMEEDEMLADDEKDDESDFEEHDEDELINIFEKEVEDEFVDDHKEYEEAKNMISEERDYIEEKLHRDHQGVLQGEYVDDILANYEEELVEDEDAGIEEVVDISGEEEGEIHPLESDKEIEEEFQNDFSDDQQTQTQTEKESIVDPTITALVKEAKNIIGNTIDITIAAGVGIIAAIAAIATGEEDHSQSAMSILNMESATKQCIGFTLAGIGLLAGLKEIISAATEKAPSLPICSICNKPELEQPGCQSFCSSCGECDEESCWKDGTVKKHCLQICHDCNTNCVVCETNVATIKKHHEAFTKTVHGKLSTHLQGTLKDIRMLGSSLIIAGIITCVIPAISWSWSAGLIAGSLLANSGIRIIAKPTIRIKCNSCEFEDDPEKFEASPGCQTWCVCCGVRSDSTENFCLALCEDCN